MSHPTPAASVPPPTPPAAARAMASPMGLGNPNVPPPSVPLSFILAGGIGLIGFGIAAATVSRDAVVAPMNMDVIATVHLCMLAFLTTTVLGAIHQFAPVVTMRPLRSALAARVTMVLMVATAWLLPLGFAMSSKATIITGGLLGTVMVALAAWNLSRPLAAGEGGVPRTGLRLSVTYLVITVGFGVTYALDLHWAWFTLVPHRVLAHAHLGLLGWLGLTYMAVAEKLWPMFLLSHRPSARSGTWAVRLMATGTAVFTTGLLFDVVPATALGAAVLLGGFAAHLTSLVGAVRHRRRKLELLHAFLFTSAAFLIVACMLGIVGGIAPVSTITRTRLISAEVVGLAAWLGLAVIGHTHKIVPFISYSALRARGIRMNASGKPLLFGDLFDKRAGRTSLVVGTVGFASILVGLLSGAHAPVLVGGAAIAATGIITTLNLGIGSWRGSRLEPTPSPTPPPAFASAPGSTP